MDIISKNITPGGDDMCALKMQLQRDEEVVFESERAILTNRRLLANLDRKRKETVTDDISLGNVATFKKSNSGRESRVRPGLKLLGTGLFVTLIQVVAMGVLPAFLELVMFLAGALGVVSGLYLILDSVLRIKPYTSVVFTIIGSRDVPVYFPGKDNPEADELARLYVRTKRNLNLT